jgi:hypothetical protein
LLVGSFPQKNKSTVGKIGAKIDAGGQNWGQRAKSVGKIAASGQQWSAKLGPAGITGTKPTISRSHLAKCGGLK